jgi:hypothetical protein
VTVVYRCDRCRHVIDPETEPRFGVEFTPPLSDEPGSLDDNDDELVARLIVVGGEPEFHFCSPSCLAEWAFGRGLDDGPRPER